jgi:hypothetical protein
MNWGFGSPQHRSTNVLQFFSLCLIFSLGLRCLNVGFMPSKGNLLRTQAGLIYWKKKPPDWLRLATLGMRFK